MNSTTVRRKNTHPIVTLVASLSISVVFTLAASVVLLIMSSSTEFVRPRDLGLLRLAYKYLDGPIVYLDRALPALVSRHFYLPDPANILPLSAWTAIWNLPLVWLAAIILSLPVWMLVRRFPPGAERPKRELFWERIYPLACFLAMPSLVVIIWFEMGYPLDSGNPNILWLGSRGLSVPVGDDRSIRRWVHGDCLLHKAVEEFSPAA